MTHCPDDFTVIALLDPPIAAAVSGFHLAIAGSALCPEGTHSEVEVGPENHKLKNTEILMQGQNHVKKLPFNYKILICRLRDC